MTPQQKSDELIEKYKQVEVSALYTYEDNDICIASDKMYDIPATNCAIIAVEEILNLPVEFLKDEELISAYGKESEYEFWNEVLSELKIKLK